jgi:hypothetical protein
MERVRKDQQIFDKKSFISLINHNPFNYYTKKLDIKQKGKKKKSNLVPQFSISTITSLGFPPVPNSSLGQPTVQVINGIPPQTNQIMPCGSRLTRYVPT